MVALAVVSLLVSVVVAALAAAWLAERWARTTGLRRALDRLRDQLGTDDVDLVVPGRPRLVALLGRDGTDAIVTAHDVPVGDDAQLRRLVADVGGVRVHLRTRTVTTSGGSFRATIDEAELARLVDLPSVVSRLELADAGLRVWTVLGVPLDVDVLVVDGGLRLLPDPAQLSSLLDLPGLSRFRRTLAGSTGLRVAVPPLPFGAEMTTIAIEAGRAELTGDLPPTAHPLTRRPRRTPARRRAPT